MTSCEMQGFCLTVLKIKGLFFLCRSSGSFAFWGLKLSLFAAFSLSRYLNICLRLRGFSYTRAVSASLLFGVVLLW